MLSIIRHYLQNTRAFIWVVDASDTERFRDSREALNSVLEILEEETQTQAASVPVLV